MLKLLAIAVVVALAGGILLESANHSKANAATTEPERFTTYRAPTGPELTVSEVQGRAVAYARRAHQAGALTLTTAHSTFAQAHAAMMGESLSAAQVAESGSGERAEEMRSPVWITTITAVSGAVIEPINSVRRGHKAPSGKVLAIVADAHTGFIKEEYLGPTSPDMSLLGPATTASVPTQAEEQESATATVSVRLSRTIGAISGRLSPSRVHWPVSVANTRHRRLATEWSLPAGPETQAGAFSFREQEGVYVVSAPRCGSRRVVVRGRRETHVVLHCK